MINSNDPCPYVRAAFSLSTPEQIDEVQPPTITSISIHEMSILHYAILFTIYLLYIICLTLSWFIVCFSSLLPL